MPTDPSKADDDDEGTKERVRRKWSRFKKVIKIFKPFFLVQCSYEMKIARKMAPNKEININIFTY